MVDIARDAAGGASSKAREKTRSSARRSLERRCAVFRARRWAAPDTCLACAKHFAGYGAADGGRDYDSAYIPEELLRNVYLPPFHAALEAGSARS